MSGPTNTSKSGTVTGNFSGTGVVVATDPSTTSSQTQDTATTPVVVTETTDSASTSQLESTDASETDVVVTNPSITTNPSTSTSTGGITIDIVNNLGFCNVNADCESSTYCCSDFSCADPSICLHGGKQQNDMCDYGFECMSRCCVDMVCSHFLNCYQTCKSNEECTEDSTPCCSQGYCTDNIVCQGNKSVGDTCSHSYECLSDYCENKTCKTLPDLVRIEKS